MSTDNPAQPKIDRDEQMDRDYIPLPGGWELQTKGKGSTLRLCDTKTGERHPLAEPQHIVEFIERMAREVYAAAAPQPAQEPVGKCMTREEAARTDGRAGPFIWWGNVEPGAYLYAGAAPAQAAPVAELVEALPLLTHEWDRTDQGSSYIPDFGYVATKAVRAIEAEIRAALARHEGTK